VRAYKQLTLVIDRSIDTGQRCRASLSWVRHDCRREELALTDARCCSPVFVDGPIEVPRTWAEGAYAVWYPNQDTRPPVPPNTRAWWIAESDKAASVSDWQRGLSAVDRACATLGPFAGVLGFSQGGMLSVLMAGMAHHEALKPRWPNIAFDFYVTIGSGVARSKELQPYLLGPFPFPSLHLAGSRDFMLPRTQEVTELFVGARLETFEGGHAVPRRPEDMRSLVAFIQQQTSLLKAAARL